MKTGHEELVGATGEVRARSTRSARCSSTARCGAPVSPTTSAEADAERGRERGARVRVEAVEGLTLRVRPLSEAEPEEGAR